MFLCSFVFILSASAVPFPDTGQTGCYDNDKEIPCPNSGQPFYGQDANFTINPPSYTKLDSNGNPLGDSATSWAMVRDNVTGLIWEVKQNKDGVKNYNDPRDADNQYTWYDPSDPYPGTPGDGTDTKDFLDALNNARFGGFDDWRLPSIKELTCLADYGKSSPVINTDYFPDTYLKSYWSSTSDNIAAWCMDFGLGFQGWNIFKFSKNYAMAVRGGKIGNQFVDNGDGTVTDISSGLMWQKGSARDGGGNYKTCNWEEALKHSEDMVLGGYSDWRLPSIRELSSIIDYSRMNPAIDTTYFPDTAASHLPSEMVYWSSTTIDNLEDLAWVTSFYYGLICFAPNGKKGTGYVRAVRGGQSAASGNLRVDIEPEGARNAGAGWRVAGTEPWRASGYVENGIAVGSYTVEFKVISGWNRPENALADIKTGETANLVGVYSQQGAAQSILYVNRNDPFCGGKAPCYASIKAALDAPGEAKLIMVTQGNYGEDLEFTQNQNVKIEGGYNDAFGERGYPTAVSKVSVMNGTLVTDNLEIRDNSSATVAQGNIAKDKHPPEADIYSDGKRRTGLSLADLTAIVVRGTVEDHLLNSRSRIIECSWDVKNEDSLFIGEFIRNIYRHSLGRNPQPWAIDLWESYVLYLSNIYRISMEIVFWDVVSVFFTSQEYMERKRSRSEFIEDSHKVLLWREPLAEESLYWIGRNWTERQLLHALACSHEFTALLKEGLAWAEGDPWRNILAHVYAGLLDRIPEPAEFALWESDNGEDKIREVILNITSSKEFDHICTNDEDKSSRLYLTLEGRAAYP